MKAIIIRSNFNISFDLQELNNDLKNCNEILYIIKRLMKDRNLNLQF